MKGILRFRVIWSTLDWFYLLFTYCDSYCEFHYISPCKCFGGTLRHTVKCFSLLTFSGLRLRTSAIIKLQSAENQVCFFHFRHCTPFIFVAIQCRFVLMNFTCLETCVLNEPSALTLRSRLNELSHSAPSVCVRFSAIRIIFAGMSLHSNYFPTIEIRIFWPNQSGASLFLQVPQYFSPEIYYT